MAEVEAGSAQNESILAQARLERQQAYHRLNIRRIYLPLAILGIIVLSFAILTVWQALFPDSFAGRFGGESSSAQNGLIFISATADLFVLLLLLPFTLLCGLIPLAGLGYYLYARQRNWSVIRFLQRQIHFVENQVTFVDQKAKEGGTLIASGVATYRGFLVRLNLIIQNIRRWIFPSGPDSGSQSSHNGADRID